MENKTSQKYTAKANDSFKTKLNLYFFNKAIEQDWATINIEDFRRFEICTDLVDLYTTEYWQLDSESELKPGLTNDAIYRMIEKREKEFRNLIEEFRIDYVNSFPEIFPHIAFEKLLEGKICDYCHVTIDEIIQLSDKNQLRKKNYRGWSLEIDRLDSNLEYKKNNCVMACYWCNNAKTDEFTGDEFKEIGKEIRKVWEARLGKKLENAI